MVVMEEEEQSKPMSRLEAFGEFILSHVKEAKPTGR